MLTKPDYCCKNLITSAFKRVETGLNAAGFHTGTMNTGTLTQAGGLIVPPEAFMPFRGKSKNDLRSLCLVIIVPSIFTAAIAKAKLLIRQRSGSQPSKQPDKNGGIGSSN